MSADSEQTIESNRKHVRENNPEEICSAESTFYSGLRVLQNELQNELQNQLVGCMEESKFERTDDRKFLPRDDFKNILSNITTDQSGRQDPADTILHLMGIESKKPSEQHRTLASYILNSAKKVFLIAIWIRLENLHAAMELFRYSNFKDENLPLGEWPGKKLANESRNHPFVRMENDQGSGCGDRSDLKRMRTRIWDARSIGTFQEDQWMFLAPMISGDVQNCHFDRHCPIPFIERSTNKSGGAHGIVYKYKIHHAHFRDALRPEGTQPHVVAVKAFRKGGSNVAADVAREVKALAEMNKLGNDHIVKFITSFQRGTQDDLEYFVLFEWADGGNLSDFWGKQPKPKRTASLAKWVISQLCGLAGALSSAHYMPNHAIYRHGDLKPGNILWFPEGSIHGTLKIGDWGEAKSHNEATALRHDTTAKFTTRRYEPPETGLQPFLPQGSRHVRSRLYDVWGMGCIVLEFIIWLLYGHDELRRFNNSNQGDHVLSYHFYEIHQGFAKIHGVVEHWMEHMAKDGLCRSNETALGDLLRIVRTGLLVVELPEAGGSEPQADDEPTSNSYDAGPSINITKPESSDPAVVHASKPKHQVRLRATELKKQLDRIVEAGVDEHYWHLDQDPRPAPVGTVSSSHLAAPSTGKKIQSASLRALENDTVDYGHPSLDPEDWEFELDNNFAANLLSQLRDITVTPLHRDSSSVRLCATCGEFEERLLEANFTIAYGKQTLQRNAEAGSCDLCRLLWRNYHKKLVTGCEIVRFQRLNSTLRMSGVKQSMLIALRSNDTNDRAHDIQIGLPELPEAGTELHFASIRGWLNDCDKTHSTVCKPSKHTTLTTTTSTRLPTRLISVGSDGDHIVRLQEMQAGDKGDWIALSYRWGDSPPFFTTRQNLRSHTTGMDLKTLPRTFQDAIKVTRALGQKYLWIDSICIIQGKDGDFSDESKRMEEVYSGAYCVLAASCATDQRSGFLLPRAKREYVALNSKGGDDGGTIYICSMIEDFRGQVLQGDLHKRGWVLQEHALARRTVFFTELQTYWECGHGVRCETMMKMSNQSAALLGDPDFPKILDPAKHGERILRFQELYQQYSRLNLSSDYDRPTAIDGLQQRLLRTMGVEGGFGVLDDPGNRGLLHRSLLWHRGTDTKSLKPIAFPSDREHVPSWSWMSVSGGIDYFTLKWRQYDWQDIQSPWPHSLGAAASNAFVGQSWALDRSSAKENEDNIVFDDPADSKLPKPMAIVLGIEKGLEPTEDKKHYILVVKPKLTSSSDSVKLYGRIGAGYIPGKCLKRVSEPCTLV